MAHLIKLKFEDDKVILLQEPPLPEVIIRDKFANNDTLIIKVQCNGN